MRKIKPLLKKEIAKQFHKQMKVSYPSLTVESVTENIENWEQEKEAKGIIEMFLFPELDNLLEHDSQKMLEVKNE